MPLNNDLQIFEDYFLRLCKNWKVIKPHLIIHLLQEWQKKKSAIQKSLSDNKTRLNHLKHGGIDSTEQKIVDFLKDGYSDFLQSNIQDAQSIEEKLDIWIKSIVSGQALSANSIHFLESQPDIKMIFEYIQEENDSFKKICLRTIRSLLFGYLIERKNSELKELSLTLYEKHLRDLKIHMGEIEMPKLDSEMEKVLSDAKSEMLKLGTSMNEITELFETEIFDLDHLFKWHGFNSDEGIDLLKEKINSVIKREKNKQNDLIKQRNFLASLIGDFETNKQEWVNSWKGSKIPDEEDLF